jgi:hypothetical protein
MIGMQMNCCLYAAFEGLLAGFIPQSMLQVNRLQSTKVPV